MVQVMDQYMEPLKFVKIGWNRKEMKYMVL